MPAARGRLAGRRPPRRAAARAATALAALCAGFAFLAVRPALAQDSAESLAAAQRFAAAGAPVLALARVERSQLPGSPRWAEWEELRLSLLVRLGRHEALRERAAALAPAAPERLRRLAWVEAGFAAERLGRGREARAWFARALWQTELPGEELRRVRLGVIGSWFAADAPVPAEGYAAMLRYELDHPGHDPAVAARFVQWLLDAGLAREAITWVPVVDDGHPVRLAARLRLGALAPEAVAGEARNRLAKGGDPGFAAVLRAAGAAGNDRLTLLEAGELMASRPAAAAAPAIAAAELWRDYLAAAREVAARLQLPPGDEVRWSNGAARLLPAQPVAARALFAALAVEAKSAEIRAASQLQLVAALREAKLGGAALLAFGDTARFPRTGAIAASIAPDARRLLGEIAAEQGEPGAALEYWSALAPRLGMPAVEWQLRQAAVRLRAGQAALAAETARAALAEAAERKPLGDDPALRAIALAQAMLDAEQFAPAALVLETLHATAPAPLRRGVAAMLARALDGRGEPARAAELWLELATLPEAKPGDAIEARVAAARALARAGLHGDARAQYEWLVRNGREAAVVEAARRELARLRAPPGN
jgi:hypothetical protein